MPERIECGICQTMCGRWLGLGPYDHAVCWRGSIMVTHWLGQYQEMRRSAHTNHTPLTRTFWIVQSTRMHNRAWSEPLANRSPARSTTRLKLNRECLVAVATKPYVLCIAAGSHGWLYVSAASRLPRTA